MKQLNKHGTAVIHSVKGAMYVRPSQGQSVGLHKTYANHAERAKRHCTVCICSIQMPAVKA